MNLVRLIFPLFLLLAGCQRHGVIVHEQPLTPGYLASFHVGSPDPRLHEPPKGQMLIAEWWVPKNLLAHNPKLLLHMLFWDYSEKTVEFPICSRVGYDTYSLINNEMKEKKGFLAYKAEIVDGDGEVYKSWQHQLWVKLINVDSEAL